MSKIFLFIVLFPISKGYCQLSKDDEIVRDNFHNYINKNHKSIDDYHSFINLIISANNIEVWEPIANYIGNIADSQSIEFYNLLTYSPNKTTIERIGDMLCHYYLHYLFGTHIEYTEKIIKAKLDSVFYLEPKMPELKEQTEYMKSYIMKCVVDYETSDDAKFDSYAEKKHKTADDYRFFINVIMQSYNAALGEVTNDYIGKIADSQSVDFYNLIAYSPNEIAIDDIGSWLCNYYSEGGDTKYTKKSIKHKLDSIFYLEPKYPKLKNRIEYMKNSVINCSLDIKPPDLKKFNNYTKNKHKTTEDYRFFINVISKTNDALVWELIGDYIGMMTDSQSVDFYNLLTYSPDTITMGKIGDLLCNYYYPHRKGIEYTEKSIETNLDSIFYLEPKMPELKNQIEYIKRRINYCAIKKQMDIFDFIKNKDNR